MTISEGSDLLGAALRPVRHGADALRALDPTFFEKAARVYGAARRRRVLPEVERALLEMSLDALSTQLDQRRLAGSIRAALATGATRDEVVAVLEVVSVIGLHTMTVSLPILFDIAPPAERRWTPEEEELIAEIESPEPRSHRFTPLLEQLLRQDPEYFADFISLIDHQWSTGVLTHRFLHLVCLLIDTSCSHLYEPGIRLHAEGALESGATVEELLEVLHLASTTGLRSLEAGLDELLAVEAG